eukprot:3316531-Karenia_brevis.AAC.1
MKLLNSPDEEVVRHTMRRLHVRFWRSPTQRLSELLRHAGPPSAAIDKVKGIVDTCRVCRMWTRPGPRSMTTTRLATGFNEIVQWDILFWEGVMISHCIDEAIRWSAGRVLFKKAAADIIKCITVDWIRPHGPMRILVSDQEWGIMGEESAQWLDRSQIQIKTKEPGSHAQI